YVAPGLVVRLPQPQRRRTDDASGVKRLQKAAPVGDVFFAQLRHLEPPWSELVAALRLGATPPGRVCLAQWGNERAGGIFMKLRNIGLTMATMMVALGMALPALAQTTQATIAEGRCQRMLSPGQTYPGPFNVLFDTGK